MIEALPPYPEMRDSGVAWLASVPAHWKVLPNRALFTERQVCNLPDEPMLSVTIGKGIVKQANLLADTSKKDSSNLDRSKYKLVEPGDLAYNKMRAWQGAIGLSYDRGIVSPAYIVMRPFEGLDGRYYDRLLRTPSFATEAERWSYGITSDQWSLRSQHFKMIYCPRPPADEQSAIVRFLADADRRIGLYVAAKLKLVKLLAEAKAAIVHRAVTRGLDPAAPMKPSGVPWLGDIPAHWEIASVKRVASIKRGRFTHRPRNDPELYDGAYPFIQTGEVARAKKYIQGYRQTLNELGRAVSASFPAGTLVMSIAANIGDVAILNFEAFCPDSVIGFIHNESRICRDYLYSVFGTLKDEFIKEAPVNTQGNLNVERVGGTLIPLPSIDEQLKIVYAVDVGTATLDRAIATARAEIALLREYRTRLIANVVTGKLDVRAAAAALPEVADDAPPLDVLVDEVEADDVAELAEDIAA